MVHRIVEGTVKTVHDIQRQNLSGPSQPIEPVQVVPIIRQVECEDDSNHIVQHETRNAGEVPTCQPVPEYISTQVAIEIGCINRVVSAKVPTDPTLLRNKTRHQVPLLDKRVSDLLVLTDQVKKTISWNRPNVIQSGCLSSESR